MEKDNANQMFPVNGLRICVDAGGEDVTGRVYTPLLEDGMAFAGLQEMFLKADRIFDKAGYPEAMQQKRTFKKQKENGGTYHGLPEPVMSAEEILAQTGKEATFDVVVNSRKNTTWQGVFFKNGKEDTHRFESEMELIAEILAMVKK